MSEHGTLPHTTAFSRRQATGRPLLTLMRRRFWSRSVAVMATVALLHPYVVPFVLAAELQAVRAASASADDFGSTFQRIENVLGKLETKLAAGGEISEEKNALKSAQAELDALDTATANEFGEIERKLKENHLPQVILDRHSQVVDTYKQHVSELRAHLLGLDNAATDLERADRIKTARMFLKEKRTSQVRPRFDPKNPSTRLGKPVKQKPKLTRQEFVASRLFDNPRSQFAAQGTFRFDALPGASDPAYLAETEEIKLTPAVKQKAADLGYRPVNIFNWVRDNVEWIPSWGALQSADLTLGSRRGNALDIAALLIALLRESGIPARYVHGTVEVPADDFKNWAGAFDNAAAAADFASAGGIPIAVVPVGGKIAKVRFEHVWVEAAIDFAPSRGAVNLSADRWVELDASYKKVDRLTSPDVIGLSGLQINSTFTSYINSGTSDPTAGWRQGLNAQIIDQGLALSSDVANQIATSEGDFLQSQYQQGGSGLVGVGDLSAGLRLQQKVASVLPAGLPYKKLVIGARYGAVPSQLQGQVMLGFGLDALGEPQEMLTLPFARVNNQKLTIGFTFASAADHDTYASLFPPGPYTSMSQLAFSIPAYLIYVVPEIRLNDQVIIRGAALHLGDATTLVSQVNMPTRQGGFRSKEITAGSYMGLAFIAGGVNPGIYSTLQDRYRAAGTVLNGGSIDAIVAYAPDLINRMTGDAYYAGLLEYMGRRIVTGSLITRGAGAGEFQLGWGVATFGYVPRVAYRFGLPRALLLGTLQVDGFEMMVNAEPRSGDADQRKFLLLQNGILGSSIEGGLPAYFFSNAAMPQWSGYSAANNLAQAMQAGQKIYYITGDNRASLGQLGLSADAISDMSAALDAGWEVITHQFPLAVPGPVAGLTSAGYILLDPATGEGQYLLDNGTNGGSANVADDMMAKCAYTNRPGFVDNDVDWARFQITRRCAEVSRDMKEQAAWQQGELMAAKIRAVGKLMGVYAKIPIVIADCMVKGAPLILSEMLVLIRTGAAMLAVQAADLRSTLITRQLEKVADKMKDFVDAVGDLCVGG